MKFEFDIPEPESCICCRFHSIVTGERYGSWKCKCLINTSILVSPAEILDKRHPDCPGRIGDDAQ